MEAIQVEEIAKQEQEVRMDITYSGENEWTTVAAVETFLQRSWKP